MMTFLSQHLAALRHALHRLLDSPLNTALSLMVIGVALALPVAGWIVLDNIQQIAGNASNVKEISVFMTTDASKEEVTEIEERLSGINIVQWRFVSREEALGKLQATEGMSEIVAGLQKNPLPDAFIVEPSDTRTEAQESLAAMFREWPKVAHVQIDSAWSKRFDAFLRIGRLSVTLLAALFAGALVAVTFNTIRLQILAQAAEIEVARLIGATNAFIRRPFSYFGALQGALGGLFAVVLVIACGRFLSEPVGELIALYGGTFVPTGLLPIQAASVIGAGAVLGWLGAQISVAIHLRSIS